MLQEKKFKMKKFKVTYKDYAGIVKVAIIEMSGFYEFTSKISEALINESEIISVERILIADSKDTIDYTQK